MQNFLKETWQHCCCFGEITAQFHCVHVVELPTTSRLGLKFVQYLNFESDIKTDEQLGSKPYVCKLQVFQEDHKKLTTSLKFMFSKKATKIDEIFTIDLTATTYCQIDGEDFVNFCGLLRKREL